MGGNAWGGTLGRNLWTATKQVLKARIWTRISESSIVFHGDSENRSPEADFGLPGAENPTFSIFHFSEFSNSRFPFEKNLNFASVPDQCAPPCGPPLTGLSSTDPLDHHKF